MGLRLEGTRRLCRGRERSRRVPYDEASQKAGSRAKACCCYGCFSRILGERESGATLNTCAAGRERAVHRSALNWMLWLSATYEYQQDYPNAHHPNEGYSHPRGAGTLVGSANIALTFPRACSHRARLRCNCLTKVEELKHVWSAPLRPDSWGLGELTW
jgi:hypothetical protein